MKSESKKQSGFRKVLFLVSSMAGGGAERVAALLCNAWAARGWQVTLMPTFSGRGGVSYPLAEAVNLHYLADDVEGKTGKVIRLKALRRHIRHHRPDVIISFLPHVNIAAILAAMGSGVPVIACERTYPPLQNPQLSRSYQILRRILYPRAALVLVQSEAARNWQIRRSPDIPVQVIPNSVQYPLPQSQNAGTSDSLRPPNGPFVLSVGRFVPSKRTDLLLATFVRLAPEFPDWNLVLLGEGAQRKALQEQVARAGMQGRVLMPGFVGNLGNWYKAADIYVMTSAYEGMPNTLMEAMAHGLPSVVFDIKTGPREVTDNGRRAVLLPDDRHVDRLTEALRRLMADEVKRRKLGHAAKEVREAFSMERILSMWDAALAQAIGKAQ